MHATFQLNPAASVNLSGFRLLLTLLLDLPDLPHRLLQDGAFVRFDVKAVDVAEVGGDQLGQLFDVLALLLPSLPLRTARSDPQTSETTTPLFLTT